MPLSGLRQTMPLSGLRQTMPLSGLRQTMPLSGPALLRRCYATHPARHGSTPEERTLGTPCQTRSGPEDNQRFRYHPRRGL